MNTEPCHASFGRGAQDAIRESPSELTRSHQYPASSCEEKDDRSYKIWAVHLWTLNEECKVRVGGLNYVEFG